MILPRETSLEAYEQIKAEGLLSKRRLEAYEILFHQGPMTANEVSRAAGRTGLWKRLSELREMGLAREVGERECRVTGRNAILWDVTKNKPVKLERPVRHTCRHCQGRGYITEQQARLF